MGNPDTLIGQELIGDGAAMWSPPHPDYRIEEHRSWMRRRREARGERSRAERSSPAATDTAGASGDASASDGSNLGGESAGADAVVSAAAALAKGAIGFQIILMATVAAGQFWFGGPSMVITGGSMEPAISVGSAVLTSPATATGPMPGDIVSFDVDGHTVTHRVIERDVDELTTRGDANPSSDSTPIHLDEVIGNARLVVPFVGLPHLWFNAKQWFAIGPWVVANLFGIAMIRYDSKRAQSKVARSKAARGAVDERATAIESHPQTGRPQRNATRRLAVAESPNWVALFPAGLGS